MQPTANHSPNARDATPDVEMIEPPAAKASNTPQPAPSSASPPTGRPTSQGAKPAPGSVAPILSNGRPLSSSPVGNKEVAMQPPASTAGSLSQAAGTTPAAASPHLPQATPASRHEAPTFNPTSSFNPTRSFDPPPTVNPQAPQTQSRPSLSQQVSTYPRSSGAPAKPPAQHAPMTAPNPSPASQPPVPAHALPSNSTPVQSHAAQTAHRIPSDQPPRPAGSPTSSQQTPFREPHTPSALDPYTVENIFSGGGYHLSDAADSQLDRPAYVNQCNQLYAVLRNMNPSVVRRVIRDTWQTSLAGSEAHVSFVVGRLPFAPRLRWLTRIRS